MLKQRSSQRGAYLIVASVLMVVLLGFGALALDVGRLFVLRSQMQNGVDAAALAAAAELSRTTGSRARAEAAARSVLEYDSAFSEVSELLGTNISLEFFCAIGSRFDPDATDVINLCSAGVTYNAENKVVAGDDIESHYVRVTMDQSANSDAYSIPLFFLPVLDLLGLSVDTQSFLQANAVAGRNYLYCDYPPIMMCNPFEDNTPPADFRTAMNVGEQIILADQGPASSWTAGNFAFLSIGGQNGASTGSTYLADQSLTSCTNPILTTEPGQMTQFSENAVDTRFDLYLAPGFGPPAWSNYPPAPDVIDYPRDQTYRVSDPRFGNGDWDRTTYWTTYHAWQPWGLLGVSPSGPSGEAYSVMSRYQMYLWEISNNYLPVRDPGAVPSCTSGPPGLRPEPTVCDGVPDPGHVTSGTVPERRVLNVAVINCEARGIAGRETFPIFGREGFAKMFLTEQATDTSSPGGRQILGEYLNWEGPGADSDVFVDVQLYE